MVADPDFWCGNGRRSRLPVREWSPIPISAAGMVAARPTGRVAGWPGTGTGSRFSPARLCCLVGILNRKNHKPHTADPARYPPGGARLRADPSDRRTPCGCPRHEDPSAPRCSPACPANQDRCQHSSPSSSTRSRRPRWTPGPMRTSRSACGPATGSATRASTASTRGGSGSRRYWPCAALWRPCSSGTSSPRFRCLRT
jgi:hypothetical protein